MPALLPQRSARADQTPPLSHLARNAIRAAMGALLFSSLALLISTSFGRDQMSSQADAQTSQLQDSSCFVIDPMDINGCILPSRS